MEKPMDWEQNMLLNELRQGRELTNLLRRHLHPSSSPETRRVLVEEILSSYEKALSMLNCSGFLVETQPKVRSHGSDAFDEKHSFKKRKTCSGWSEPKRVCSGSSLEGPLEDGYCWRKYGQKAILGSSFPRGYYRCSHRYSQGCLAAKQVQRSDEDPTIFELKYRGRHTCIQATHLDKDDHSRQRQQLEENQKQSKETAGLYNRDDIIFPSFSFPIESGEVENGIFAKSIMENDIAFVSPVTSDSKYFSVSPFQMGSFGLGQNVLSPESGLTEIISAPTSVANSPIVDLRISSLEELEFVPSFTFDNPEFFS